MIPLRPRLAFPLAAAAGLCVPLAAPVLDLSPLAFLAAGLLLVAISRQRPTRAFQLGLVAGWAANLVGFYWIVGLLSDFAHLPWIACLLLFLLLSVAQALGWALAALAASALARRDISPAVTLPVALVTAEFLVPSIFPWTIAVTQYRFLPLIQMAEWTGVWGIALVVTVTGALLGHALLERRLTSAIAAVVVLGVPVLLGSLRLGTIERLRAMEPSWRVGVAQPNIGIYAKHDPAQFRQNLATLQAQTAALAGRADLVVWPESAYPYSLPTDAGRDGARGLPRVRPSGSVPVLFGTLTRSPDGQQRHNSAMLVASDGTLEGPVHKNVLLAFGEYVPLYQELPWLRRAFPRAEGFTPGAHPGVLSSGPVRAGVLNCYEDILPSFGRALAARRPNLLVNITNDSWFGDTSEPHLHLALSVFRAVELRRDLVRAVNGGVSAFVDATGRIAARSGTFEKTVLAGEVRLLELSTPYAQVGDVVAWGCAGVLLGLGLLSRRRSE